jgi:hypothetical protein
MNTEIINEYKILVGKPQGMRPVRRPSISGENNIKMDLTELRCEVVYMVL